MSDSYSFLVSKADLNEDATDAAGGHCKVLQAGVLPA